MKIELEVPKPRLGSTAESYLGELANLNPPNHSAEHRFCNEMYKAASTIKALKKDVKKANDKVDSLKSRLAEKTLQNLVNGPYKDAEISVESVISDLGKRVVERWKVSVKYDGYRFEGRTKDYLSAVKLIENKLEVIHEITKQEEILEQEGIEKINPREVKF